MPLIRKPKEPNYEEKPKSKLIKRVKVIDNRPKHGYTPQKGVDYFDGVTPTDEQLIELIQPLIPTVENGKDGVSPTTDELLVLIRPLIPTVKDGETPSDERLIGLISQLLPTQITVGEVVDTINSQSNILEVNTIKGLKDVIDSRIPKQMIGSPRIKMLNNGQEMSSPLGSLNVIGGTITNKDQDYTIEMTGSGGGVETIVAGANITVDNTDPANPIVSASSAATLTYMFANIASDIATYWQAVSLNSYVVGALGTITTAGVSTTPTLIGTFATNLGFPNLSIIPAGEITLHCDTEKLAGSNNYYVYAQVYKRVLAGTETLIATSDNSTQVATNVRLQQNVTAVVASDVTLLATDRIVVKWYGVMVSSTATIYLYYDDSTSARIVLPTTAVDATNYVTVSTAQTVSGAKTFSATPTFSTMTAGSVAFFGTGGLLTQDNQAFFWENTDKILNVSSSLGAELITNGTFTGSATGWTVGAGWVYSSNSVSKTSDGLSSLQQNITIQTNTYLQLTLTLSNVTVGSITISCGGATLASGLATNGTYTYRFLTTNNNGLTIAPSNTARLTIDTVSLKALTGGGIRTSGGGYFGSRVIVSRTNTSYSVSTNDHLVLSNPTGSNTNLTFTFGQVSNGVINGNSSGVMSYRATSYHQFYAGAIDSGTQAVYFDTSGVKTTGGVFSAGKVIAGSVNTNTPVSIGLSSNGGYAGKGISVFTPITLTAAYQYVYADTTIAQACGGTTSIVCSSYTGNVACNAQSAIGCSWSGGTCDEFVDEESCNAWTPQCGWVTTADCSDFNGDEATCSATTGCTANFDGGCNDFNGNEAGCTSTSGCTYDSGDGTCSGAYYTSCSGTYDVTPYCDGGEYGDCNGTASCSNITDETTCTTTYAPCTWSEILQLTLPTNATAYQGTMGLEYYIKKIGGTGTVKILANTGDKIDGANDYSITTLNDAVHLHMYPLYESCLQYTSWGTCVTVSGCSWGSDPCSAYDNDEGPCTGAGCSYDGDTGACYGTEGSCSGTSLQYYQWNILSNKN